MRRILINGITAFLLLLLLAGCTRGAEETADDTGRGYGSGLEISDFQTVNPGESNTQPPRGSLSDFRVARVNGTYLYASDVGIHLSQAEEAMMWEYFFMYNEFEIDPAREYESGVTFGQAIRREAVRTAAFYIVFNEYARQMGITLTELDQERLDAQIELYVEHFGQEELDFLLQAEGFRDIHHYIELFYQSQLIVDQLIARILDDPAEFARFEPYMPIVGDLPELFGAKHILAAFDNFESEAAAEVFAADILARALAGEDFDTLMWAYSQDPGLWNFPEGYSFGSGEMVSEFEDTTRELQIGEISGLVPTSFGIHIIMRIEPNAEDWLIMQYGSVEERMVDAIFKGLQAMAENADIVFLAELDDV
jgi:foldase protein PrsA